MAPQLLNSAAQIARDDPLNRARGYDTELAALKTVIRGWIDRADADIRPMLEWQFLGRSKYFRPVTVFACHQAMTAGAIEPLVIGAAVAIEMAHNVSLIIDDILDRSRQRRGVQTLHCRFGTLPAIMCAGYITAEAFDLCRDDAFAVNCLADLNRRLAAAEVLQWRLRRQPLGIEDWRIIAREDTGSMFETCACMGTGDERLRAYGQLLGILYHGCDDVGDVRGAVSLGGGGEEDIRDGILTLPVAIAIRDPETARQFRNPSAAATEALLSKIADALPRAEQYLDQLVEEAVAEARSNAKDPSRLIALVNDTRTLSR
jgi:geranylgeranyl pyrophosphate synthase